VLDLTVLTAAGIHVGMSAKVEVHREEPSRITIPLTAIIQRDNLSYVKVQDKTSGKLHEILVKTGQTTMDSVVIDAGLQVGERIIAVA
jgi:multidrug efflux pump subunit AcrA (membrane-fusion protein)